MRGIRGRRLRCERGCDPPSRPITARQATSRAGPGGEAYRRSPSVAIGGTSRINAMSRTLDWRYHGQEVAHWMRPASARSYNLTLREIQGPWSHAESILDATPKKMDRPHFRHAACLIAASIVTDVLMMLGRTRRTSNPGKVRRGALARRRPIAKQLTNSQPSVTFF